MEKEEEDEEEEAAAVVIVVVVVAISDILFFPILYETRYNIPFHSAMLCSAPFGLVRFVRYQTSNLLNIDTLVQYISKRQGTQTQIHIHILVDTQVIQRQRHTHEYEHPNRMLALVRAPLSLCVCVYIKYMDVSAYIVLFLSKTPRAARLGVSTTSSSSSSSSLLPRRGSQRNLSHIRYGMYALS